MNASVIVDEEELLGVMWEDTLLHWKLFPLAQYFIKLFIEQIYL